MSDPNKPFLLLCTRAMRQERQAVADAILECMTLARLPEPPTIQDYGHYRSPEWRDEEGALRPYLSVDWYIAEAWNLAKAKLDATQLMKTLAAEPWRRKELIGDHYDVWLVDQEMYDEAQTEADPDVVSFSRNLVGLVVSARPFEAVGTPTYSLVKTVVLHELGHLFGLPDIRRPDVALDAAPHCTNTCVMRQASHGQEDWQQLTTDRLTHGPYCEKCLGELRTLFQLAGD